VTLTHSSHTFLMRPFLVGSYALPAANPWERVSEIQSVKGTATVALELLEGSELSALAAYEHVFHRRQIQTHCQDTHYCFISFGTGAFDQSCWLSHHTQPELHVPH